MNALFSVTPLLAQMGGKNINELLAPEISKTKSSGDAWTVLWILLGVVAVIGLAVIVSRRKKIRRLGTLSRSAWPASASKNRDPGGTLHQGNREHRHGKRKRREHRPRNPTLAQTGGLPPKRPEDQAPTGL